MGPRSSSNDAAMRDAQIMLRKEECAGDIVPRSTANIVAVMDAQRNFLNLYLH